MTSPSILLTPKQRALTSITEKSHEVPYQNEDLLKKRKLAPLYPDYIKKNPAPIVTNAQDLKISRIFSSKDDLDLLKKPKKINEPNTLLPLDLAQRKDTLQKNLTNFFIHRRMMDIIAMTGTLSEGNSITPQKTKQIDDFFYRKKIESDTIYLFEKDALLKTSNTWKKYKSVSGGYHLAFISDTEVLKIGKQPKNYKEEQDRLRQIYNRIGIFTTGIQKSPPPLNKHKLFLYLNAENIKLPIRSYHKEYPYKTDLLDLSENILLSRNEQLQIFRSIIFGSKIFIKNGIYHLDTKLANIGYLGSGKAEHFDFGNAIIVDFSTENIRNNFIFYNKTITLPTDAEKLHSLLGDPNKSKLFSLLEKIHIFQLGSCFYNLETATNPYDYDDNNTPLGVYLQSSLRRELSKKHKPIHVNMILRMLSDKPEDRPTIEEVNLVFQEP